MAPRPDEQSPDREIMEHIPQEPIAADPPEEGEAEDGAEEEDDQNQGVGHPVEQEDERR